VKRKRGAKLLRLLEATFVDAATEEEVEGLLLTA
jgi:hypothetical protein